jgi:peptide/nickel transport system substrate-binding protein
MDFQNLNRRDFLRLSGLSAAGVMAAACGTPPAPGSEAAPAAEAGGAAATGGEAAAAPVAGLRQVPRERTLILMFGGDGTQFTDTELGNPYAAGATHQIGSAALWEPLYYYSAFADEHIPWLAESYEYNDDFTELTIKIRSGVEWSDGVPFTANDVAFTIQMLQDHAPSLRYSTEMKNWVAEAVAVDDATVRITFNDPRPRFMLEYMSYKFDTGMYFVPAHVFGELQTTEEIQGFKYYDKEKGWPLATGPYKIVEWTTTQKFMDLREDWWGAKTGFAELPQVERILMLPRADDTRMVQLIVNDEVDSILDLRASTIPEAVRQNPNIITHTGRELPYGYVDWWPTSMWFNCDEGEPYGTKEMRWAVSYSINRQQMLEVALGGSGEITPLPFPRYPALQPFFDAAQPLLEKYPTNEYNPEKAAELLQGQGYTKDSEGFWARDGQRLQAIVSGWQVFTDIGPVIAEQLRQNGFEADFITPPDNGTRIAEGVQKIWLNGHGGSFADPFTTMDFYTSKHYRPQGEPAVYASRWRNEEYDAILEEMASTDPQAANYMDLYLAALEIWLDNLVDAPIQQWFHRIPMNTTYWEGWPTQENAYVNGAFWHLTFPMILRRLTPRA